MYIHAYAYMYIFVHIYIYLYISDKNVCTYTYIQYIFNRYTDMYSIGM